MGTGDMVVRRSDYPVLGLSDSGLHRARKAGRLVRIVAGAYADAQAWSSLRPIEQHRIRVLQTAERLKTDVVFSHYSAAALWGIRMLGAWPQVVDVTLDRNSGTRSSGGLRRHTTALDLVDVVTLDGLTVSSPAQTVVDLARGLPFADGVVAMDSALHRKRRPYPLATIDGILERVCAAAGRRGYRRAHAAWTFATPLSDSPEESHSRVQIHLLGFPAPVLQHPFRLQGGSRAEVDFFWPEFDHVGECDGRSKYTDPAFLRGRTSAQAVIEEKNRENEIRRAVKMFSRWEPRDLYPPSRLRDRLLGDGLPRSGSASVRHSSQWE